MPHLWPFTGGLRTFLSCSFVTAKFQRSCYIVCMPTNLHRCYGAGYSHFITTSCYQRRPLAGTPRSRNLFIEVLEEVRQRYQFVVVGYVVMPEHVHLLFTEPERGNLSLVMAVLKQTFAHRVLRELRAKTSAQTTRFGVHPSRWDTFGNAASTILSCSARRSAWKSCATCIAIPSSGV
jgi:REP element-mobilizing transposase RayT